MGLVGRLAACAAALGCYALGVGLSEGRGRGGARAPAGPVRARGRAVLGLLMMVGGRLSDRTGRRKIFVFVASVVYGSAMFVIAIASDLNGSLVGMAIGGLGFGLSMPVDLALVVDVLPGTDDAAKNPGVLNIAATLPASVAPAIAPVVLATGGGYGLLYAVAGGCAVLGAFAILPVRRVR